MNASNRSEGNWKAELSRTAECVPIELLDADLTSAQRFHLNHCARCQAELALWKRMQEKVQTPEEAAAVTAISKEVRRRTEASPSNIVPMPRSTSPFMLAAAAALVIAIGIGIFVERREPSIENPITDTGAYRSAAIEVIAPPPEVSAAPAALQWKPVAGATTYDVRIFEVDGTPVWQGSTRETHIEIPAPVVTKFVPGKSNLWQVRARRDHTVIADSGQQRFRVSIAH